MLPATPAHKYAAAAPSASPARANEAAPAPRSPSLLPPDRDDADGRFTVAEEVSLDQQSDNARDIGALPPDPDPGADVAGAVADTLAPPGERQPSAKDGGVARPAA
ncbi:hypothetical protein [Massilia antarctica]|uniref:hypothetical protein n=1 Tax=Massilia antarctica TaxID=2765360 RepID=UPI0006BB9247|nr:hypothetical protein [Massilia sp. H27-R4]MCY0910204.1 hypothetical protein [Massilia sp. H27-R4]CUI02702.1 hypothetical protein BN2497_181 [Janthinobacterium sp. CG23_2]CUU26488.1 hypothetical protein BN3177_181 [Janthinobacterium sp. CG23_2]